MFGPVDGMERTFHVLRDHDQAEQRVTYLELFFDLVFVFAITQLSQVLLNDLTWKGFAGTSPGRLWIADAETSRGEI